MKYDLSKGSIEARVARGAQRFDSLYKDWWHSEIVSVEQLDESHPKFSVFGQHARYVLGANKGPEWYHPWTPQMLGYKDSQEAALDGFYHTIDEHGLSSPEWNTPREYFLLTEAWKVEILKRRNNT